MRSTNDMRGKSLFGTALAALLLAAALSCDKKPAENAPKPATSQTTSAAPDRRVVEFGSPHLSFVDWLERDGRFVVLHRFTRDTNEDGEVTAALGDHGEPEGDWPIVTTVDLRTGDTTDWDELLATDPRGRWVVVRSGDEIVALSAGQRTTLEGADPTPGPSPCMPARQAAIEPSGTWVSFIRDDPERLVVRHLQSGKEREYEARGKLWRGDPTPLGWAVLREVTDDTDGDGELEIPVRKGSCVCRWCSRFATSVGGAGFAGDDHDSVLVSPDGKRHPGFQQPLPVADGYVWSLADNEFRTVDGKSTQLGPRAGCRLLALPIGSGRVVVRCGSETLVWDPVSKEASPVEQRVAALELFAPPRSGWIAVRIHGEDGTRAGRLSIDDAIVEPGPPARRFGAPHPSGWLLAAGDDATWAFDIHSGTTTKLGDATGKLQGLVIRKDDRWVVPNPSTGELTTLKQQPVFVDSNGCYVEPHEMSRPTKGPFRYVCP